MSAALIAPEGAGASEAAPEVDPAGDGRSLAVAEVQQALRELRARRVTDPDRAGGDIAVRPRTQRGDKPSEGPRAGGDSDFPSGWITVRAAHAGAGASTVALAISDAAAAAGRSVHLIENAHCSRSGLVAAAETELGLDDRGLWRRGLRSSVTLDRRATEAVSIGWPEPAGGRAGVTVLDLGDHSRTCSTADGVSTVIVCRPTVPGMRLAEQLLDQVEGHPVVAAVGPSKWAREVAASSGPRLRALRIAGRVVPVPIDRHLQVTGLTDRPLPRSVLVAGRALLQVLDPVRPAPGRSSISTADPDTTREKASR